MKPETRFWHWLSDVLPPEGHYSRVEPPPSPGIPDVHFCIGGVSGWIELKCLTMKYGPYLRSKLRRNPTKLRPSQKRWLKKYVKAGGRAFVIAKLSKSFLIIRAADALAVELDEGLAGLKRVALEELPVDIRLEPQLTSILRYRLTN